MLNLPAINCADLARVIRFTLLHPDFGFLLRRDMRGLPSLFGFHQFGVPDDLPVVLELRQLGAVQILTELPELRVHIIEIDDADRRLLATDDAQRLAPVPASDSALAPWRGIRQTPLHCSGQAGSSPFRGVLTLAPGVA
jgi:hypothetical protein